MRLKVPIPYLVLLTGLTLTTFLSRWITPYMVVATLNFILLLFGYSFRHKNRKIHAASMTTAMLSDLCLVLVLEFQRDAIATAVSFDLSFLNQAHILSSTLATLLYFPVLFLGILLLRSRASVAQRKAHRRLGTLALCLRAIGFILMFSMLQNHG